MNVNELYDSIHDDGFGRLDDVMIHAEPMWVRLSCPITSPNTDKLHMLCHDLVALSFSEATNNDACEIFVHERADVSEGFLYVTATILDWLT